MARARVRSTLLARFASIAAALALAASLVPLPAGAEPADAGGAEPSAIPGGIAKIADPDTSGSWETLFGAAAVGRSYSTADAGRIWVDKSVYATAAEAEAAGVPNIELANPDFGFLVGLSAMSSAVSVRTEQTAAHDVVFVVSLNSTMSSHVYDGRTYAEHLADALNASIGRLMQENADGSGPAAETRIAVVGYSIDATVLMPLGTYSPDENGDYVAFSRAVAGGAGIDVVATPDDPALSVADAPFRGHAYLQRAIAAAGDILEAAGAESSGGSARVPELVVMGTEVAATANTDIADPPAYAGEAQGEHGFLGSLPAGYNVGYGTDAALATLLTMQDVSKRVEAAYGGARPGLYTVGLDTQALGGYVLQTARGQAAAHVEGTGAAAGVDLCANIEDARAAYAQAAAAGEASVTIPLYSAGRGDLVARDVAFPAPVAGLLDASDGYAFRGATAYLLATDAGALPDSFDAAVDGILDIEYSSPVNKTPVGARDSSDRLRVEDDLGRFMTVGRVAGIEFDGRLLDGSLAAAAVAASFADPWDIEAYHEVQYLMYALNARYDLGWGAYNLLYEAFSDGQIAYRGEADYSNRASWYVDADHAMIARGGEGYTFASQAELDAIEGGNWREASPEVRGKIESAASAGATAVCETYFYIGNLANQYTGADVPLYDFVVMVETSLADGSQRILFSAPADSLPALKVSVTQRTDGSAVMELDDGTPAEPLRILYEAAPRADVSELASRIAAGESVPADEIEAVLGDDAPRDASGAFLLYATAFSELDGAVEPHAAMTTVTAASNGYYAFLRDEPLYELKDGAPATDAPSGDDLVPLESEPIAGRTYYYEQTSYEADGLSAGEQAARSVTSYVPYEIAVAQADVGGLFAPNAEGQYCALAGTPKFGAQAVVDDYAKQPNATATASYSKRLSVSEYRASGEPLLAARLGNNGVLAISPSGETGSLAVSKSVADGAGSPATGATGADRAFPFAVTLSTASGSPLSGSIEAVAADGTRSMLMLDEDGTARFSLRDGETTTLPSLPAGTVARVEELAADGSPAASGFVDGFAPSWEISVDGTAAGAGTGASAAPVRIEAGAAATAAFKNEAAVGSLAVQLGVSGNAADPAQAFVIDVRLTSAAGDPVVGTFPYRLTSSGKASPATGTATADASGSVSLEGGSAIELANGQGIEFFGVPVDTTYAVSEPTAEQLGYRATATRSVDGGAPAAFGGSAAIEAIGQRDVVAFDNERMSYGTLRVEKRVTGTDADADRAFGFTVSLEDGSGAPLSGDVPCETTGADGSSSQSRLTLDGSGSASFQLADGESLTLSELPQGTVYRVVEQDCSADGYIVKRSNDEGVVGSEPAVARFENVKQAGSLGIAKIVEGATADRGASFSFSVIVEGLFAARPDDQTADVPATRYLADGGTAAETVTFARADDGSDDGIATIDGLHHNEGLLIEQLASDAPFTVTELGSEELAADGYRVYAGTDADFSERPDAAYTGTLSRDTAVGVYFANVNDAAGTLSVAKEVLGNAAEADAAAGRTFAFAAFAQDASGNPIVGTFDASIDAAEGSRAATVSFENGIATFELPANATIAIDGLPAGTTYDVVEQSLKLEGYETTSEGASGTVPAEGSALATFVNEKRYVPVEHSISGTETLRGRDEAAGEFAFQLYEADGVTPVLGGDGSPTMAVNAAARAGIAVRFELPALRFDQPGTYAYVVRERVPDGAAPIAGVSYDSRAYRVSLEVRADATGALFVSSETIETDGSAVGGIAFVNEYRTSTGSFELAARKALDGRALSAGEFGFSLQEIDPASAAPLGPAAFARNDADGTVSFGSYVAAAPLGGTVARSFLVAEALPSSATEENGYRAGGIAYDARLFRIDVTGSDAAASGTLSFEQRVSVQEPQPDGSLAWRQLGDDELEAGAPIFRNVAGADQVVVSGIRIEKTLAGRSWSADDSFSFRIAPVSASDASGAALSDGAPEPADPVVTVSGFDAASQGAAGEGGTASATVGDIAFTEEGTYVYAIYEQAPGNAAQPGIDYSSAAWLLSIAVTRDGNGALVAHPTLRQALDDDGSPVAEAPQTDATSSAARFRNAYADDAYASFDGAVDYVDETGTHPIADGMFRFRIAAVGEGAQDAPLPALSEAGNAGSVFTFGSASFPNDDELVGRTFSYEVSQVIPADAVLSPDGLTATANGIVYDASVQTIAVSVVRETLPDGSEAIRAIVSYPEHDGEAENRVVFRNICAASEDPAPEPDPDPGPAPGGDSDGAGGSGASQGGAPASGGLASTGDSTAALALSVAVCALVASGAAALAAALAAARERRPKHRR